MTPGFPAMPGPGPMPLTLTCPTGAGEPPCAIPPSDPPCPPPRPAAPCAAVPAPGLWPACPCPNPALAAPTAAGFPANPLTPGAALTLPIDPPSPPLGAPLESPPNPCPIEVPPKPEGPGPNPTDEALLFAGLDVPENPICDPGPGPGLADCAATAMAWATVAAASLP